MCQEIRTGVLWSKKKKEYHINLLDLLAIKFALLTFSKTMNIQYIYIIQYIQYIYTSRQPNCLELPLKDGRGNESRTSQSFEGDLGLSSQTSDDAEYCGVPPRLPESSGRLGVEKSKGFHRVKTVSANIPENL